jgi:hypothetical protein
MPKRTPVLDEELPINSLDRFRKRSTKLRLDFIDDGDAPVGCGGAVLRWRNPSLTRAVRLSQVVPESAIATIDGKMIDRRLQDLAPGKHVYAVQISASKVDLPVVLLLLQSEQPQYGLQPSKVIEPPINILSGDLAGWSWSLLDSVSTDWRLPEFEASGWQPVVRHDDSSHVRRDRYQDYMYDHYRKLGAIPLGPPKPWATDTTYCIRFEFEIPAPILIPDEE